GPVSGAWVMNDHVYGGVSKPLAAAECTVYALDAGGPRTVYAQHDGKKLAGFVSLDGKETGAAVLKLEATATVTGRVLDQDGTPLKDVRVSPSYDDSEAASLLNMWESYRAVPVLTDAGGKFTLANVPAGLT